MSDRRPVRPERHTFNVAEMRERHAKGEGVTALARAYGVCCTTIHHHLGRRERQRMARLAYNVAASRRPEPNPIRRCQGYTAPYVQCTTLTDLPDCPTCGAMIWRPEAPLAPEEVVEAPKHLLPRTCRRCHKAFQPRSSNHVFCKPCGRTREINLRERQARRRRLAGPMPPEAA